MLRLESSLCSERRKADFMVILNPGDFPEERLEATIVMPGVFGK
jgi:hypothetical protein